MSVDPKEFAERLIKEAEKEAQRIIEEAKKKANEILENAKREAEKIRREREREFEAAVRAAVAKLVGREKRKAKLEVSLKRRELVDKAIKAGFEEAKNRIHVDVLSKRLEEVLKTFPDIKRQYLEGPEYAKPLAERLGVEFKETDIHGFRLVSEDITIDETLEGRLDRRYKRLEAIAAEEVLGRRVRL